MTDRPQLAALSTRLGVVPAFFDLTGCERHASDETREAIVAAMGHDASSEDAARRALEVLEEGARSTLLAPVNVWREHAADRPRVELRLGPEPRSGRLELVHEDGHVTRSPVATRTGTISLGLPWAPPQGYHQVRIELDDGRTAEQLLVVVPRTAPTTSERLGTRRAFGVGTNLYTVRGERGFGFGDVADLDRLVSLVAGWGGDFVGLNPLHALRNRGNSISPYSPVSRLWRNLLYLDVERVPELARCDASRALLALDPVVRAQRALAEADRIDYERVLELKLGVLRELHRTFLRREREGPTARGRAFAGFVEDGGDALRDFATFEALAERFPDSLDWRLWPERYRAPRSDAVTRFRDDHPEEVDLYRWIQFELDRQLAAVAGLAHEAGLAIGLINDLAVGSPPDSADAWAHPGLVARGVSVGAPPDAFSADGQDWGLAPIDPNRLRADGYRLWTRLLRASFRHAGGLRIDHAIGLERSFWIPDGRPGSAGAYVRQPAEDLLGVLALEARRAGALAIGEDLGVVPEGLKLRLASWGLVSTNVLLFERDGATFRAPERYSPRTFVAATTHDLVPLDGFVEGADLRLRARLDEADEGEFARALEGRRNDVESLAAALDGAAIPREPVAAAGARNDSGVTARRVHAFLDRTPAPLLALALDDLAGEREPINLPGISTDRYRSWCRRMTRPLGSIVFDPAAVRSRAREVEAGRGADGAQDVSP